MLVAIGAWIIFAVVLATSLRMHLRAAHVVGLGVCFVLLMQIGIRPLMFFLGLDSPTPYVWFDPNPWGLMAFVLLLASLWLVILNTVYLGFRGATGHAPIFPSMPVTPHPALIGFVGLVITLISLALTGFLLLQAGGIAMFVFSAKIGKDFAGLYVFREVATLAATVLLYGVLVSLKTPKAQRGFLGSPTFLVLLILVNFGTNYLWGNRYNIALMILASAAAYHFYVRPLRLRSLVLLSVLTVTGLEGLKVLRFALISEVVGRDVSNNFTFWHRISASFHFNQFDAMMLATRDVGDKFDFRHGQDALSGLLAWVPRAIYPDKETFHTGGWFRRVYEPQTRNGWPITVVGNWYINFGILGILFGAALSGAAVAIADQTLRTIRHDPWIAATGPVIAFQLFDGGINFNFLQSYILLVVPLALVAWVFRFVIGPGRGSPDLLEPSRAGP